MFQRLDKGSKNSSLPPSADSPKNKAEATKTHAERRAETKAKRKDDVEHNRGKQPGAPGANLARRPDPDEIVDHLPTACGSCGDDLADAPVDSMECRQVFDIPEPVVRCIEHSAATKRCKCGATTRGPSRPQRRLRRPMFYWGGLGPPPRPGEAVIGSGGMDLLS